MSRSSVSNRSSKAYDELRRGILEGRWEVGERLSTYRLSEELGMSRTPVIEALKRLEADGLIEIVPQVGCRILPGRTEDVEEAQLMRTALEGLAAEVAAERISDEQLTELDDLAEACARAIERQDVEAYEEHNLALHRAIVRASGLTRLEGMLDGILTLQRFRMPVDQVLPVTMPGADAEHREVIEALRRHDGAEARAAMERHMRRTLADYRERFTDDGH